ncbi:hypothetical protein KIN20_035000 [Parelaphostrongylus tenuis]|uniref:Reverse transcriptase domain-containing protein n=1 Tax=Parelaphostrongylus tenuis TaxID=148309 RepID=A0AAD5WK55_PARTN|nr:hypothetical protein KIN20_035000 [Parelaphostrongylus tenuis]
MKNKVLNVEHTKIHGAQKNKELEKTVSLPRDMRQELVSKICSLPKWSGNYFAQIKGLAMGQRLAPTLAIAFMSEVEASIIDLRPFL